MMTPRETWKEAALRAYTRCRLNAAKQDIANKALLLISVQPEPTYESICPTHLLCQPAQCYRVFLGQAGGKRRLSKVLAVFLGGCDGAWSHRSRRRSHSR